MQGKWDRYSFRVGVLTDRPHKLPKTGPGNLKSFHGGKARKKSTKATISTGLVSWKLKKFLGFDFYRKPFTRAHKKSAEILKLFRDVTKFGAGKTRDAAVTRRVENSLQAVVRNPFLRGDYGRNTRKWAKIKGFNKLGIDTGQLFDAIKAKVF